MEKKHNIIGDKAVLAIGLKLRASSVSTQPVSSKMFSTNCGNTGMDCKSRNIITKASLQNFRKQYIRKFTLPICLYKSPHTTKAQTWPEEYAAGPGSRCAKSIPIAGAK